MSGGRRAGFARRGMLAAAGLAAALVAGGGCTLEYASAPRYEVTINLTTDAVGGFTDVTITTPPTVTAPTPGPATSPYSFTFQDALNFGAPSTLTVAVEVVLATGNSLRVQILYEEILDFPPSGSVQTVYDETVTSLAVGGLVYGPGSPYTAAVPLPYQSGF